MIADLTCFPHRWHRGFLVCFKDTSSECTPAEKNSVAICLGSYHIFTGLLLGPLRYTVTYILRAPYLDFEERVLDGCDGGEGPREGDEGFKRRVAIVVQRVHIF